MSITYLTTFLELKHPNDPNATERFQNSLKGDMNNPAAASNKIQKDTEEFKFLPFIYQGAAKSKSGDNLEAQIVLANNSVAMNHVNDALKNRCNVTVSVCKMKEDFTVDHVLTTEHWLLASFAYDATTIEVLLSSSIDAVGTTAPNRVFTTAIVGFLPRTANIQTL
tara:strand:- start:107 stop:604 length:498 start_codon:yes stop_codon:yes gene_type:complete